MSTIKNLRTETLLDTNGNPVRVLVLDAQALGYLHAVDQAIDAARDYARLIGEEGAARDYARTANETSALIDTYGPRCGHSACSQNFIDTGSTRCVRGEPL